jgi:hypothetical protein
MITDTELCTRCQERTRRNGGRYCKECHAAYQRGWRTFNPLTLGQRQRSNARAQAHIYLKRGKIERQPCKICGADAEMHHPDYAKPREVEWLCRDHHLKHHEGLCQLPPIAHVATMDAHP